jgi:CRP/FNR family transcriptional regulator, cyclic AMP receptor protein
VRAVGGTRWQDVRSVATTGHHHADGWVPLLQVDTDLAARLPDATMMAAAPLVLARTQWLDAGVWRPAVPPAEERCSHLGYLVIDGFITRQLNVLQHPATELLGRGDLLLPWEPDRTEPFRAGSQWEALDPVRVAVLDRRFTALLARWPEITVALTGRAVSRSRALALTLAISQLVGIDIRLLAILWYVAERWGVEDEAGVVLPVRLTHNLLASLISARRPTVTRALGSLVEKGRVSRRDDGLLMLHGDPPTAFPPAV